MATYGSFATDVLTDWLSGKTLKAMLVTSAYVQDVDAHATLADINAIAGAELVATDYTAGGVALTSVVASYDPGSDQARLACDNIDFGTLSAGATDVAGLVVYVDTGTASTSRLVSADLALGPVDVPAGDPFVYTVDPATGFVVALIGG